jgi:hypothetical protein
MRITFLLLSLCLLHGGALAQGGARTVPPQAQSDFGYPSPDAALAALRVKKGVTLREENDWYVASDPGENTFWSITKPEHPAHPAAVKRTLVQDASGVRLTMKVKCGASKEVCDGVVHQFEQINENLSKTLRSRG